MSVKKKALERAKRLDRVGIGRVLVKAGDPAPDARDAALHALGVLTFIP